mmetsp:Transcript_23830/g.42394  ORF Transcript_23830/g.42394 Transcript_23830/m.42394 type:complete len:244 (+) Transcript_23830:682-1413(+)
MLHVLLEEEGGGDVGAPTEPPLSRQPIPGLGLEVTVVEVHGGRLGVPGVHDRGDAGGEEWHTPRISGDLLVGAGRGAVSLRRHGAVHDRHIHARLLPHLTTLEHTGDAATAARAGPRILVELCAVSLLNCRHDGVLRVTDGLLKATAHAVGVVHSLAQQASGHLLHHLLILDGRSKGLVDPLRRGDGALLHTGGALRGRDTQRGRTSLQAGLALLGGLGGHALRDGLKGGGGGGSHYLGCVGQ